MKVVGYIVGACVVLALVRAVAAALIIGFGLAVVVGVCLKPRETFGLLAFMLVASLAEHHGGALLLLVGAAMVLAVCMKR